MYAANRANTVYFPYEQVPSVFSALWWLILVITPNLVSYEMRNCSRVGEKLRCLYIYCDLKVVNSYHVCMGQIQCYLNIFPLLLVPADYLFQLL